MDKLSVDAVLGGVHLKCDFKAGLNSIDSFQSATGKTFLLSLLKAYLLDNGVMYRAFNYDSSSADVVGWLGMLGEDGGVALLDNADLYLDDSLRDAMEKVSSYVVFVISIKRVNLLPKSCCCRRHRLSYIGSDLICMEVSYEG